MNRLMIFDCENICTKKLNYIIENLKDWDVILYFGNSQRMNNLPKIDGLEVIQASGTGKNYADFQIVAEFTYKMLHEKYKSGVIVSNDCGFEAAIEKLKKYNFTVNRYSEKEFIQKFNKTENQEKITIKIEENINTKKENKKEEKIIKEKITKREFKNLIGKITTKNPTKARKHAGMIVSTLFNKYGTKDFTKQEYKTITENIFGNNDQKILKLMEETNVIEGTTKKHLNINNINNFIQTLKTTSL